jgi:hypothetical protein
MRAILSFVGGLLVAALLVGLWFFGAEKRKAAFNADAYIAQNATAGRYQLVHGKVIDAAGQDADIIMRIDTATGQTWECRVELSKGLFWRPLTDDPLITPQK